MKTTLIKCSMVIAGILLSTYSKAQPSFTHDYAGQCPPITVTFTNTTTDSNAYVYIWNFGDGTIITDTLTDSIIHTFTQGGWYNVMLQVFDSTGFDIGGWQDQLFIEGVRFMISVDTACPGDEIYFYADDSGNNSFWDFGDGNTMSAGNPIYTYSFTGNFTVTLIAGEGTTCGIDTITRSIVISNTAIPDANFWSWPNPVCPNDMVNFEPKAAGTFYWDFDDGNLDTTTNPRVTHAYNALGPKNVKLTVINGCSSSDTASATVSVQNSLPFTGWLDFDVSADSACPGDAVFFDCWQCDEYAAFSWDFGDGSPPNTTDTRTSHSYDSTDTYTITLTVFNGCGSDSAFTRTVVIDSNVAPDMGQYGDGYMVIPPIACQNDPILFIDGTLASGFWDFGDGDTASSNYGAFLDMSIITHAYTDTGTYTGTFTITNGCGISATDTFFVTIGDSALIMIFTGNDGPGNIEWNAEENDDGKLPSTTCEEISFIALGGGNIFSWNWGDGNYTTTNTPLITHAYNAPNTYTISLFVQNSCGDTATFTANITIEGICPLLTATASGSDPTCKSIYDGSATATVTGGTPPYTYLWDDPMSQTDSVATGLSVGAYIVIVTDAAGDNVSAGVTLTPQFTLSILIDPIIDASCGGSDGVATASASGGASSYTYQWSNGATGAVNVALSAGFYIVTVTDANGCSDFALATVSDNNGPIVTVVSTTDADCNGSGGAIDIFISQGTTPYTYLWSNGAVTDDISSLAAGPYEVYVTDANGCVGLKSVTVAGQDAFSLTTTTTDATCGNPDGSATVSISGGASPFTFSWSSGGNAATESNIAADVYNVTVIDANGCVGSATATVSETGGAAITIDSIINEACNGAGGSVYISVTGGALPYTFLWSNLDTIEDISGLSTGTYDVTVTGSNGCIATASGEITMTLPSTEPICLVTVDSATGKNLVVWEKLQTQGIKSYNIYKESTQSDIYYLIDSVPATDLSQYVDALSDPFIRSWRYKISAVDSCGNESDLSAEHKTMHLTVNLGIPPAINLIWDHYQGFTFGTYIIYRYIPATGWDSLTSIQSNLTSATDPSPPSGALYQVVAQHPNGCQAIKKAENYNSSRSNTTSISTSNALTATTTSTDATFSTCDGTATVLPQGGTPPYTYAWNTSPVQTDSMATALCGNTTYSVTVYDANGDSVITQVTINELTGIADVDFINSIKVFPNPSRGVFTISTNNEFSMNVRILVYDMLGQLIYKSDIRTPVSEIDISAHRAGIYHLQIITDKGIGNKKIIIE